MAAYALQGKKIYVAGHRGMVGGALMRRLAAEPVTLVAADRATVDLRDQAAVRGFFRDNRPDVVLLAAARVGGILANNTRPAEFLQDNLTLQSNVIGAAYEYGVEKLVFLGSSCIYPKFAPQPIVEDALLTGPLEPTNEWYAIAKIAGLKLCQAIRRQYGRDFISVMPTNLYGPGDNYDLQSSHVVPALIRKAHAARLRGDDAFTIWGSGAPLREFMHVDDCADAIIHVLKTYSEDSHINIGSGEEVTILDLARIVAEVVGFRGRIDLDATKPDGTPRKLMDSSRLLALGWRPRLTLKAGLADAYRWFLAHHGE